MSSIIVPQNHKKYKAALAYATRLNWHVVPLHSMQDGKCTCSKNDCSSAGKHPRTLNGLSDSTTDPTIIDAWWTKWPEANIGIRTGAVSGFFAIDIDPRHGGNESFDDLTNGYSELPHTVEALTGGGGRHLLFEHPGWEVKNDSMGKVLGTGIDIRGDGGYIVVAPSNHQSGGMYEWELSSRPIETPIAAAPEWLLHKIREKPQATQRAHNNVPSSDWADLMQGLSEGGRNASAASLIGHLLRRYVDPLLVYEIVQLWNTRNNPPLDIEEIDKTFNSIAAIEGRRRGVI